MPQSTQCLECAHYEGALTCKAYPEGIPAEIATGKHDHRKPYPGDGGVRFKAATERTDEGG